MTYIGTSTSLTIRLEIPAGRHTRTHLTSALTPQNTGKEGPAQDMEIYSNLSIHNINDETPSQVRLEPVFKIREVGLPTCLLSWGMNPSLERRSLIGFCSPVHTTGAWCPNEGGMGWRGVVPALPGVPVSKFIWDQKLSLRHRTFKRMLHRLLFSFHVRHFKVKYEAILMSTNKVHIVKRSKNIIAPYQ